MLFQSVLKIAVRTVSKPIVVITVPLIFTKYSFLISLYTGKLVIT